MASRVSKDVRSVRLFEQALLTQYQVPSKRLCLCVLMHMCVCVSMYMCVRVNACAWGFLICYLHPYLPSTHWQAYLQALYNAIKGSPPLSCSPPAYHPGKPAASRTTGAAHAAQRSLAMLLVARPGFNFSSNIVDVLVPLMACRDEEVRSA